MSNVVSLAKEREKRKLELRESRNRLKKEIYDANLMGKRLEWVMNLLGLGVVDIQRETGMPEANVRAIILGSRYRFYEELNLVCNFLNRKYQEKFGKCNQHHDGYEVEEITFTWLILGHDSRAKAGDRVIELLRKDYEEREIEYVQRILELEGKIERLESKEKSLNRLNS